MAMQKQMTKQVKRGTPQLTKQVKRGTSQSSARVRLGNEAEFDHDPPHQHAMVLAAEWRSQVGHALREAGFNSTVPRRAILTWVAQASAPFTAEELVAALEKQHGISSRATIYRMLEWLRDTGWVSQVASDSQAYAYARLLPGHHHTVLCTQCGLTMALSGGKVESIFGAALSATNFEIHGHWLELYGLCERCRERR